MRKSMQLESTTHEKIQALTSICGCKSYSEFIESIVNPLYETFNYYGRGGKLESYPLASRAECVFQLSPKSSIVAFGQNQPLEQILGVE